jgi:putative sigma-54 modulation protein
LAKKWFYTNLILTKRTQTLEEKVLYLLSLKHDVMNVNIQSVHFDADSKLIEYINKKLEKLANINDRIVQVNVFLKLDNVVHTIKDKIAEIRVHVPRHNFFVKSTSKSFEESFDDALDTMVSQLKKNKERKAA